MAQVFAIILLKVAQVHFSIHKFQQIRNATVKLCYPNATFLIDPWLSPTFTPEERDAALHEHRFIEKPICPLPASPEKILSGVDYILVTHLHADHFSPDFLPPDAPMVFQSQEDAEAVKKTGFTKNRFLYRWFAGDGQCDGLSCGSQAR